MSTGSSRTRGDTFRRQDIDKSINLANGGFVAKDGSTINVTDSGAFELVDSVSNEAFELVDNVSRDMFDFSENALNNSLSVIADNSEATAELNSKVLNSVIRTNKSANAQANKNIKVISDLAKNIKTGDSSLMSKVSIYLILSVAVVFILIFSAKVFKK